MSSFILAGPPNSESTPAGWTAGPTKPRLAGAAAHVWRADLEAVGDDLAELLSDEERERAERMIGERQRQLWRRSRGVLRALLGRYLRSEGVAVRLSTSVHGKPFVADVPNELTAPAFNLSHSGQLALYAFTASGSIGVDVQVARDRSARPDLDWRTMAKRAFGEHEAQRLSLVEPGRREKEFLRAWTRYEAELKRLGRGIGGHGVPDDGSRARIDTYAAPFTIELDVGAGAAAALALEGPARELRRWAWARGSSQ
jgi:4'-phosphopantetheinyl transferase